VGASSHKRDPFKMHFVAGAIVATLAAVALAACSSGSEDQATSLGYPNGDRANTRSGGGAIDSQTVSDLEPAWTLPAVSSGAVGAFASSPVVVNGVVYAQDLDSGVWAVDLDSGDVRWRTRFQSPTVGPNGVFVSADRVYGATAEEGFALDRDTGKEIWSTRLVGDPSERIAMAPGYSKGLVYLSTVPKYFDGGERGTLWALDAETGKRLWSFSTVPKDLWGNPKVNDGGGLTHPPAFDDQGSMYFGVGSPDPLPGTKRQPWGSSRPGPNLYTDSVVKLDARTGRLQWYYQLTPHAICVWDLDQSPLLLSASGRDLVIAAGKAGIVVALDRRTGKPVWRRPVGIHNGHDRDGLRLMRNGYRGPDLPMTVFPGSSGGVTASLSTNGSTVFVPLINHSTTLYSQKLVGQSVLTVGEIVALDAATGRIRWQHQLGGSTYGATSAVNDLVFATTVDGTVYALDVDSGKSEWRLNLPAGIEGGLGFGDDTLVVPAGLSEEPGLVAYRLD
jgi:outer membrane protein assembly factor BamB